jgi:hypothetical protein
LQKHIALVNQIAIHLWILSVLTINKVPTMTKSPDVPKIPPHKRKKRVGFDIVFPVPKGLSFSDSDAAAAKAYYTADPYSDGEQSSQWGGKGAALLGLSPDDVRKTMEQIEDKMKAHLRQGGERSGRVTGERVWVEVTHRISPPFPLKPPKTTLWVNGVKITPKLWKRLHAMSKEEYEAFWDEQLKDMKWRASAPAAKKERR